MHITLEFGWTLKKTPVEYQSESFIGTLVCLYIFGSFPIILVSKFF